MIIIIQEQEDKNHWKGEYSIKTKAKEINLVLVIQRSK